MPVHERSYIAKAWSQWCNLIGPLVETARRLVRGIVRPMERRDLGLWDRNGDATPSEPSALGVGTELLCLTNLNLTAALTPSSLSRQSIVTHLVTRGSMHNNNKAPRQTGPTVYRKHWGEDHKQHRLCPVNDMMVIPLSPE
ncbi:hypothetical protein CIB48_g4334 [Xylaria polymorpha]|nr:hypothetical protein CIB48_g4334 [Xylaria polymorpha]